MRKTSYFFFLGGTDNEMEEIKEILFTKQIPYSQPQENWGEIIVHPGQIPHGLQPTSTYVFVECRPSPDFNGVCRIIDHHGPLSHRPASLIQVCRLLGVTPTIRQQIIASIDSDFLKATIVKFPTRRSEILRIWESGYRKKFKSDREWLEFKSLCERLWVQAKSRPLAPALAIVWHSPRSMTMLSALADLDSYSCLLICGSPTTDYPVPVFFKGKKSLIRSLANLNMEHSYYGRGYFGCKAIPRNFIETVTLLLES